MRVQNYERNFITNEKKLLFSKKYMLLVTSYRSQDHCPILKTHNSKLKTNLVFFQEFFRLPACS